MAKASPTRNHDKISEALRLTWTDADRKAFEAELDGESDRAAALVAAAYLETTVELAIRAVFVAFPSEGDEMILFGSTGAFANFAVKVRVAYLLGIFGEMTKADILQVIAIRNRFAHSSKPLNFDDAKIKTMCNKLKSHYEYVSRRLSTPFTEDFDNLPCRIKYSATCLDIESALEWRIYDLEVLKAQELLRDRATIRQSKSSGRRHAKARLDAFNLKIKYGDLP